MVHENAITGKGGLWEHEAFGGETEEECTSRLFMINEREQQKYTKKKQYGRRCCKCCFYRMFFGESLCLQAGGYDTNSGLMVEFTLKRQLLISMWKNISLIKGKAGKIKHKEFTILCLSIHIYFIHIYAWKCNAKMECVITPDEAYSKYRLSKIYDNLHFENAWKRFRRNLRMYSVIVFDQNVIGIAGSKKSKKHGQ